MTAFIITRDYVDSGEDSAVGTVGPRTASKRDMERLLAGEGTKFRLLDDDRNVQYHGRRLEESDADEDYDAENELAPLDCWGSPNAGATIQEEKNKDGKWESIN
jgi:hypothetical protein